VSDQHFAIIYEARVFRRRASSAASANSQFPERGDLLARSKSPSGQTINTSWTFLRYIDRPYKTTVDETPKPRAQCDKRDALAVDGSIYQHARAAQNGRDGNGWA